MGIVTWFRELFKDNDEKSADVIIDRYKKAGLIFGSVVSYIYMGECVGFEECLSSWEKAEKSYASLGYRTLSIDEFVDCAGFGGELVNLKITREVEEEPVYHAAYYRQHFLHKDLFVDMKWHDNVLAGTFIRPSTKHLNKK